MVSLYNKIMSDLKPKERQYLDMIESQDSYHYNDNGELVLCEPFVKKYSQIKSKGRDSLEIAIKAVEAAYRAEKKV